MGGLKYGVGFFYDAAGNRSLTSHADGITSRVNYAGLRPSSLTLGPGSSQPHIRDLAWYPFGPRMQAKFPPYDSVSQENTVISTRDVNLRGQVSRVLVQTASGPVLDRTYAYDFDDGGFGPVDPGPNLDRVVDAVDPSQSRFFFYDELDRLAAARDLSGTTLHAYGYNAVGNRTSKQGPVGTSAYAYESSSNRLDGSTGDESRDYAHDAYGNRIYDGAGAYTGTPSLIYDDSNRLIEVRDPDNSFATIASYKYDAFGRRVQKIVGAQTFVYLYDPDGHLIQEVNKRTNAADHTRVYVYLEDELVALVDSVIEVGTSGLWPSLRLRPFDPHGMVWVIVMVLAGGGMLLLTTRRSPTTATALTSASLLVFTCAGTPRPPPLISWVHTDPLGTPLAVTNNAAMPGEAEAVWRASYEPFGKATVDEDPDGDLALLSLNVRFPGQYEDAETGWHYNFYRTYDPSTGRYLEADPIGLGGGFNLYGYAVQNPLAFIDRTGLRGWSLNGLNSLPFARAPIDGLSAGFFVGRYFSGGGPVDLGDLGLGASFEGASSVRAAVGAFNALAAIRARQEAKRACRDCDGGLSLTFRVSESSFRGQVTDVRYETGLYSVGGSSFFGSADCRLSIDCSSGSYSYTCSSTFSIRDSFTDPIGLGFDFPYSTPFDINYSFGRSASGNGRL